MAKFKFEDGKVPEIDLRKLDHISSIITTFEEKDLKSENVVSFYFDKKTDYIFLELLSNVNGKTVIDNIFGFDKEKIQATCENIIKFFKKDG